MPLTRTRMRLPLWPLMIGRDAPAPKKVEETPGSYFSVSPMVEAKRLSSVSPVKIVILVIASSGEPPRIRALVITISSLLSVV